MPLKLCALATCGTLDDFYHGIYDSSFIAGLRSLVFAGIVFDTSKQTIANIEKLDSEKVDRIIQKYLDFKNQKLQTNLVQDELVRLEKELETNNLLDTYMKEKIEQ